MKLLTRYNWNIYLRVHKEVWIEMQQAFHSLTEHQIKSRQHTLQVAISTYMDWCNVNQLYKVMFEFLVPNKSYFFMQKKMTEYQKRFISMNHFFLEDSSEDLYDSEQHDTIEWIYLKLPLWYTQMLGIKPEVLDDSDERNITDPVLLEWLEKMKEAFTLRSNQQAVKDDVVKNDYSTLCVKAGPGRWKTILLFDLLATYKQKAVIVCNTKKLLVQFFTEFLEFTWLTKKDIEIRASGVWTSGKDKQIIFTLASWLKKIEDEDNIWIIFIDEIHETLSNSVLKHVVDLKVNKMFGFSATPQLKFFGKDENKTPLIFGKVIYGGKSRVTTESTIYTINTQSLYENVSQLWEKIVEVSESKRKKQYWYSHLRWDILDDEERFNKIMKIINHETKDRKYIIVLTDRKSEIQGLLDNYKLKPIYFYDTMLTHKKSNELLEQWKETGGILICIASVIRSWFNFKKLDTLILLNHVSMKEWAAGSSDLEQIDGRLVREHPDKIMPPKFIIIDDDLYKKNVWLLMKELRRLWSKVKRKDEFRNEIQCLE